MTRLHPEQRPTKEQVARDLAAWESLSTEDVALDVSEARLVLRQKLAPTLDLQATRNQQKESAMAAVRRLQQLTRPLNEALKTLYDGAAIDSQSDKMTVNVLKSHGGMGDPRVHFRWQRCSIVRPGDRPGSVALRLGRSIELRGEGDLVLHLMVDVGPEGIMGSSFHWNPPETVAPVGTIEAERMVDKAAEELAAALQRGIDALLEAL